MPMLVCNGDATKPLPQEAEKPDPPWRPEHLLEELRKQQAKHERIVEQMLETQLQYISELMSCGRPRSTGGFYGERKHSSGGFYGKQGDFDGWHGDAGSSDGLQEHNSEAQNKDPDPMRAKLKAIRQTVQRSSWRPSVQSLTELEERYAKDANISAYISVTAGEFMEDLRGCRLQVLAQKITRQRLFEFAIQGLIICNGIVLGIQQDWVVQHLGEELSASFSAIEFFFAIVFSLELLLRIMAAGPRFLSCWNKDIKWNIFDTLLVASAVLEMIFKLFAQAISFDVSAGRMLRVLRLVRVVRVIRVLRFFKDLRIMVLSITGSLRPLGFAMVLLGILIYVTAVCFMQFATEELLYLSRLQGGRESDAFKALDKTYGGIWKAAYTLFMSISGGLNWGDACSPLLDISPVLGFVFVLYIAFAVFCVLNVITGIFVEEATKITAEDEENMLMHELARRRRFITEAKRFFEEADKDGSGELSWPEFKERVEHVRFQKLLDNLGIDVVACGARNVFDLFDFDGNGAIAINEFTSGLQQMRGSARSFDIVNLRYEQRLLRSEVERLSESCSEVLLTLRSTPSVTRMSTTSRTSQWVQAAPKPTTPNFDSEPRVEPTVDSAALPPTAVPTDDFWTL